MTLARVIGQVTSTAKEAALNGLKLLVVTDVSATSPTESDVGHPYVAVDLVGAGEGEIVIVAKGSAARISSQTESVPTDSAVVAIVDNVGLSGDTTYTNSA